MAQPTGGRAWHESPTLQVLRDVMSAAVDVRHRVGRTARLSEVELATLEELSRHAIGPAALARHLSVSTAAATGIVDRLSGRGHVEREPDPDDRRRTQLRLTSSGSAEVRGHLQPMFSRLAELDASFAPDELAIVERYLRGALAAIESVAPAASEPGESGA